VSNLIPLTSLDDPRIEPYTRMKERDLAREGSRFVAEGELVVRRLLACGSYAVESVLVSTRKLEKMLPAIGTSIQTYVAEPELVNRIVGFHFHSGVMAIGLRGVSPTVRQVAGEWGEDPASVLILPRISKTDNLGSLIRIAAGFGMSAVMTGEECCDPFYRQAVRVSMGGVFSLPIVRSSRLLEDLGILKEEFGVELIAAVADAEAEPLPKAGAARRMGILMGNENTGLSAAEVAVCDRRVTIPMGQEIDSFNVSVAAGIMLYHFTSALPPTPRETPVLGPVGPSRPGTARPPDE
jgi:tRNA G18 (ribose-2'-O)-methylase SpoU